MSLTRAEMSATATVVIGNTRVVSVLSGEIIAPYPDRPTEGDSCFRCLDALMTFFVDLKIPCSFIFEFLHRYCSKHTLKNTFQVTSNIVVRLFCCNVINPFYGPNK